MPYPSLTASDRTWPLPHAPASMCAKNLRVLKPVGDACWRVPKVIRKIAHMRAVNQRSHVRFRCAATDDMNHSG